MTRCIKWQVQSLKKTRSCPRFVGVLEKCLLLLSFLSPACSRYLCKKETTTKTTPARCIPAGCLETFSSARSVVGTANLPATYEYEGVTYPREAILAALDTAESTCWAGDLSGGSSTPPGSTPGSVVSDGEDETSEDGDECIIQDVARKTRHCLMRVIGIMVEDEVRPLVMESRLSMNRTELDGGESGASRGVWEVITTHYKNSQHRVSLSAWLVASGGVTSGSKDCASYFVSVKSPFPACFEEGTVEIESILLHPYPNDITLKRPYKHTHSSWEMDSSLLSLFLLKSCERKKKRCRDETMLRGRATTAAAAATAA